MSYHPGKRGFKSICRFCRKEKQHIDFIKPDKLARTFFYLDYSLQHAAWPVLRTLCAVSDPRLHQYNILMHATISSALFRK